MKKDIAYSLIAIDEEGEVVFEVPLSASRAGEILVEEIAEKRVMVELIPEAPKKRRR
jgi:hypothetical protein